MARIKRQGLDYFPLNTDFLQDRVVRRILKREGDGAAAILLSALSCIYAGQGYYVKANELFYEDISANLFEKTSTDVKRIIALAVEYELFNPALFASHGVLTSMDIQRQYLFSTKRRKHTAILPELCLIPDAQVDEADSQEEEACTNSGINVTFTPQNVTSSTHSIAQHSIAQHSTSKQSIEHPLLKSSPEGDPEVEERTKEEISCSKPEAEMLQKSPEVPQPKADASPEPKVLVASSEPKADAPALRRQWTPDDIVALRPPTDGHRRNLDGLIFNMRQYRISPQEQYAIVLKSNFGIIGHPLWKGFEVLRTCHGKIRQPGKYLLSLCK